MSGGERVRINTKKVTEGAGKAASYELQRILLSGKAFNIFASRSDQKEISHYNITEKKEKHEERDSA